MAIVTNEPARTRTTMYFTRTRLFMWLAFVFFVLAAFVGGDIITVHNLTFDWLLAGGAASYVLASLE